MYFDGLDDLLVEQVMPDTGAADTPAGPALFEMFAAAGCSPAEGLALAGFLKHEDTE